MIRFVYLFVLTAILAVSAHAQQTVTAKTIVVPDKPAGFTPNAGVKRTAAYGELLVRKAEAEADLKILLADYTEESPEVREKQLNLKILERAMRSLEAMPVESLLKLTPAFGKILALKLEAEAALKLLRESYTEEYPSVKRAKIRLEVYEAELKRLIQ